MLRLRSRIVWVVLAALVWFPGQASGHGLIGHIHVTGWAIQNLPEGELRSMFTDPDVFKAALSGAMFPDTGYPLGKPGARDYAEHSHWEPFITQFIEYVRTTYGPTYETKEERMLIAFLLGCAAHGLQDELFDSTFLFEVEQRDGHSAEIADPGTDGFIVLDDLFHLLPDDYFPIDEILPLYDVLNQPAITRDLIAEQVQLVRNVYVNDTIGVQVAANYGRRALPQIPWAADNYLDPGVPGSHGAEIEGTMRHLMALWERLTGTFEESDLVVHTWPEPPRRLRSADHNSVASWVTFVLGKGVQEGSATVSLVDDDGAPHPFNLRYTRWGGTSRIIRLQATADYVPGATYHAVLAPGATLIDGTVTTESHELTFQVECAEPNDAACPTVVIEDDPKPTVPPSATPTVTATASATATAVPTEMPTEVPSETAAPSATRTATAVATQTSTRTATLVPTATEVFTIAPATFTPVATDTIAPTDTPIPPTVAEPTSTLAAPKLHEEGCQLMAGAGAIPAYGWLGLFSLLVIRRRS